MNHAKNKVEWCLRKAKKELESSNKHRGLVKIQPDLDQSRRFILKAEHYMKATGYLKKGNFSDINASTIFYAMYHCLLAIASKFWYESRNQECTFALINNLIEEGKIKLRKELIDKVSSLDIKEDSNTSTELREKYQYGTNLSLNNNIYNELFELAKEILSETKEIIEEWGK